MTCAKNDYKAADNAADNAAERAADKAANKTDQINAAHRIAEIKAAEIVEAPTGSASEGQPNLAQRLSAGNGSQRTQVPEGRSASHADPTIGAPMTMMDNPNRGQFRAQLTPGFSPCLRASVVKTILGRHS